MVFLNLQIQAIADGLLALGWNPVSIPPEALVVVDAVAPTEPNEGQLWLSSLDNTLSIWNGTVWQGVGLSASQVATLSLIEGNVYTATEIDSLLAGVSANIDAKQDTLISGTNIKTVNGVGILGSGNVLITAPMGGVTDLSDATVTTPIAGQVLTYSGTEWVNTTPAAGVTDHTLLSNIGTNTHAQIDTAMTRLADTSGTNTGDETVTTIKTKLGITTLSGSNTGDQDLSGYSLTSHNHTGTYEPADSTILKDSDIGVSVQAYDVDTAKTDVNQTFSVAQRGSINAITYGATITPDFNYQNFSCTLTGNVIVANPTNIVAGQKGSITLTQDATGGRTTAWGTYWKFAGGVAPTYVTTANSETTFDYSVESPTKIRISPFVDWK